MKWLSPAFELEYGRTPGNAFVPASDDTLTMWPRPRVCMPGSTARVNRIGAHRFTMSSCSNLRRSGSSVSVPVRSRPALFTRTSIGSVGLDAVDERRRSPSKSARSAGYASPPSSAASFSSGSTERATSATRAPRAATRGREIGADAARPARDDDPGRPRGSSAYRSPLLFDRVELGVLDARVDEVFVVDDAHLGEAVAQPGRAVDRASRASCSSARSWRTACAGTGSPRRCSAG